MKSTLCAINGQEKQIFKDPKTDDGTKKSQKGRVVVLDASKETNGETKGYFMADGFSLEDVISKDQLKEVFRDGKLLIRHTFEEIRARLKNS